MESLRDVASSVRDVRAASVTVDGNLAHVWDTLRAGLVVAGPFWLAEDALAVSSDVRARGAWDLTLLLDGQALVRPALATASAAEGTLAWEDGVGVLTAVLTTHGGGANGAATATLEYATGARTGPGARAAVTLLDMLGRTSATAEQFRRELAVS